MGVLEELKKEVVSDLVLKKQYEIQMEIYNIAKCLKKIRKEKNLTQKDVAQKTGLTQQMISKIESYNGNPSIESFVKYCNGVGINLLELLLNYHD
ncbi:MAG: helix-turn-helix transcriptional regulator [Lachnospiraceae bacterium]|nr:helix-turn-helix transcriptional regulator [Lachnospiraceae bacterium]